MKRNMMITGVLVLTAAIVGQNAQAAKPQINTRTSTLRANFVENHGVKMTAGKQYVSVSARGEAPVSTAVVKITKNPAGKPKFTLVKPTRKLRRNGATAYEFDIPETGAYLILNVCKKPVESYCVATTGTFVGKSFTLKLRK